ncbi:hypothetical protein [Massilia antarctica]|uniref:hypothetical protein n=1 Tax=Massilia antarctica TaxID=2765360 RepID=UPI0006BD5B01|nr:hypothetical protein [Massilia sp. H27-R4]MCY0915043.1 hypothetical protein [Massilia sp. H27-R4]CUI07014.1 Tachylectin-3 precursor [Janthinobacterium sp. CG23_2]CUU30800.1 Tachylectin-3 precursor [Janthinobacterium sp. CG23_2]
MAIRRDLDGLRMQFPGAPAIYLIDQGVKRHIPDPDTYDKLFRDWNGVVQDPHLNDIDTGTPLSHGAVLAQAFGDAAVYLIDNGVKRHIASPETMDRYYFDWNKIQHVAPILIRSIQNGPTIAWPE